jgi:hypothetical protein
MTWAPIPAGYVDEYGAAGILDVPVTRLRSWRAQRIGPAVTRRGGRVLYNQAALRRWARPIDAPSRRRHGVTAPQHGAYGVEVEAQPAREALPAEWSANCEEQSSMSRRKKQSAPKYVHGAVSEPGDPSVIHYLATRMNDLQNQACAADSEDTPGSARRYRILSDEAGFLREQIFKEQPQTLADVAIQSLLAFVEIDRDGRIEDGDEMSGISRAHVALRRQIRFFIDTGAIDLSDPAIREIAEVAMCNWEDEFPELAAKPAAEAA